MTVTIHCGDCRGVMLNNYAEWYAAFDLIFADPPFNIGHGYDIYDDVLEDNEFARFMGEWIATSAGCLKPSGVLAINVPDELVHCVLSTAHALGLKRAAWVIWHYRFGQCNRGNWINSKAHCLIFSYSDDYTFNSNAVLVPSDRATIYADSRTDDSATPGARMPLDVWGIPSDGPNWGRVQGNNGERVQGHPNQLPEKYLQRLILAYTNPGDKVLDPFGGTGTTATVASALGRHCDTIELSDSYCRDIAARVQKGMIR